MGTRTIDLLFCAFFIVHVFITILIDAQMLLPSNLYPRLLRNLLSSYVIFSGDHLVRESPPFFKGLICAEIFFQLPLYFVNAYGFFYGTEWAKTTGLIYGVHAATTMIPILADVIYTNAANAPTLMMIYIPYLLIPLWLVYHVLTSKPNTVAGRNLELKKIA